MSIHMSRHVSVSDDRIHVLAHAHVAYDTMAGCRGAFDGRVSLHVDPARVCTHVYYTHVYPHAGTYLYAHVSSHIYSHVNSHADA